MSTRQIHVFVSHSWWHSHHYDTLERWIFGQHWSAGSASLDFRDYSVPKHSPIHDASNDAALQAAIYKQMAMSHVVVIPTGMYASYSKWIRKEIVGARAYQKPILAVDPWGQQRRASVVADAATRRVGWNKEPVVNAIWELYRDS